MKKVLLFAALFAMSRGAYAQNGGLCIDNTKDPCDNLSPVSGGGCVGAGSTWSSIPLGGCREAFWNDYYAAGGYLDNVTLVFE